MKIAGKISLIVLVSVMLLTIISWQTITTDRYLKDVLKQVNLTDNIVFHVTEEESATHKLTSQGDPQIWMQSNQKVNELIEQGYEMIRVEESTSHLEEMERLHNGTHHLFLQYMQGSIDIHPISSNYQGIIREAVHLRASLERQVIIAEDRSTLITLFTILMLFFMAMGFGTFIGYIVLSPLRKFVEASENIKEGDLSVRVEADGDEFGDLARTFNEMMEKIEQSQLHHESIEMLKNRFISVTSHELRTPLTVLKSELQMVLRDLYGEISPRQKEALDRALENTDRMERLINDLLDLSLLELGKINFTFEWIDAQEKVQALVDHMRQYSEKDVEFMVNVPSVGMKTDPGRFEQILTNLISNAIKFSQDGDRIEVIAREHDKHIIFSVSDQGAGIKNPERIFEAFYQEQKNKGAGIGLTIVRGLVTAMRGSVWVESTIGQGSTFYVKLPKRIQKARDVRIFT